MRADVAFVVAAWGVVNCASVMIVRGEKWTYHEAFCEGLLAEEHPWVIVALVPVPLELFHAL